jgi:hypothetical protein
MRRIFHYVVEMIFESLPHPLNARGKAVKPYSPAISYISTCKGHLDPSKLNESSLKLNIRDSSCIDVVRVGCVKSRIGRILPPSVTMGRLRGR